MNTNFLMSILTSAYPEPSSVNQPTPPLPNNPPHPDNGCEALTPEDEVEILNAWDALPECEWCGEPSEFLDQVDESDPSVGYRAVWQMCPACRYKLRIQRANRY